MFKIRRMSQYFGFAGFAILVFAAGCAGGAKKAGTSAQPEWVVSPDAVFSRAGYIAAVGYGSDRAAAEKNALASLSAVFGQSIQSEQTTVTRYSEAALNGALDSWTENTDLLNKIKTSAELESLVGAEIRDYWYDGRETHYAAAVMERAKTVLLYMDMIRSNERIIAELVSMSSEEKNSLEGCSRYRLAGAIADANKVFANVLSVAGSSAAAVTRNGDDYRLEAANIAKNIPITVAVTNDRSRRVEGAFASAVSRAGFRSGGVNSRYRIEAEMFFSPVELPSQPNKFVRYTLDAKLIDTGTGAVLLPYTAGGREGHRTEAEAENRALAAVEKKITEEYEQRLSGDFFPVKK